MKDRLLDNIILDTSSILGRASSILNYPKQNVIIPITVVDECNKKKTLQNEVGRNAKDYFKIYKQLRKKTTNLHEDAVPLDNGGTFRIELNHKRNEDIERLFPEMENDHKILAVAVNLSLESEIPEEKFYFVTNDGGLLAKADAIKAILKLENFIPVLDEQDRLVKEFDDIHTGFSEIFLANEIIEKIRKEKKVEYSLFEKNIKYFETESEMAIQPILLNDFVICKSELNPKSSIVVRIVLENGDKFARLMIKEDGKYSKGILHRNLEQEMLMDLLKDTNTSCITIVGKAGTGKTLLSLASALGQIEDKFLYRKLLVARPVIPMGKDIGYLPGDKDEKLKMWMQPIFDNLEYIYNRDYMEVDIQNKKEGQLAKDIKDDKKRRNWERILAESPHIEMEALTYIRGRSIPNQFIIIDEAQNLTAHEIKTIVTRAGKGTKIVFAGDPEQIDNPYLDSINNGLTYLTEKMKGQKMFATIKLEKTERSDLAELASILL